jgi:hypothetical protein
VTVATSDATRRGSPETGGVATVDGPRRLPTFGDLAIEAAGIAAVTLAVTWIHLRLGRARWAEPWTTDGDAAFYLMVTRSVGAHGGYLHTANLGWPFGQDLYDYPQGNDNLHLLVLRALMWVTHSPGAAMNVFYVSTFVLVAVVAHLVLRRLGVRRLPAGVGALLYAFVPYHFARNETHLFLSAYYTVPLGVLLALAVFDTNPPLVTTASRGRARVDFRSRRSWWVLAACAALASTGAYYAVFTVIIVAVAGLVVAATRRQPRALLSAGLIAGAISLVFIANLAPSIVYRLQHGLNHAVADRTPSETERFGLRISQLYVPRDGHRIPALAEIAANARGNVVPSETGQQLGVVAAAGFTLIVAVAVVAGFADGRTRRWIRGPTGTRLLQLGILALATTLIGTISGYGRLLSSFGLRPIRSWNRVSILLAFCGLTAAVVLIDAALTALARHGWRRRNQQLAALGMCGLLAGIGWFDQTAADRPDYAAVHRQYVSDTTFYQGIANWFGTRAAVLTLPYVPFPEGLAPGRIGSYDHALGYVYQPTLRWSFGFMRGRHPDWAALLVDESPAEWRASVARDGFTAVVFDRAGYPDPGPIERRFAAAFDAPVLTSLDGRYTCFDLRPRPAPMTNDPRPSALS